MVTHGQFLNTPSRKSTKVALNSITALVEDNYALRSEVSRLRHHVHQQKLSRGSVDSCCHHVSLVHLIHPRRPWSCHIPWTIRARPWSTFTYLWSTLNHMPDPLVHPWSQTTSSQRHCTLPCRSQASSWPSNLYPWFPMFHPQNTY